jgi:hypothetical protein
LRRRGNALNWGSKPVGDSAEINLFFCFIRMGVGQRTLIRAEPLLSPRDQPEIMFGMLEITLRHHRIAGGLRIARELEIFFADVLGGAANLHIGSA